ncbi:hypothetical protein EMIT0111MI5_30245 [Burkholderia sp. IT-111MI5]
MPRSANFKSAPSVMRLRAKRHDFHLFEFQSALSDYFDIPTSYTHHARRGCDNGIVTVCAVVHLQSADVRRGRAWSKTRPGAHTIAGANF